MSSAIVRPPVPRNEPIGDYLPGSPEKRELKDALRRLAGEQVEIPLRIGGRPVQTGRLGDCRMPHDHRHLLGRYHKAGAKEVQAAIKAALRARRDWAATPWESRAAILLKAADLLAGRWRATLNAATMLGQSKTVYQAEIDAACELVDFFRFNVHFARQILAEQPDSAPGCWNRLEQRPLDGFVFAVTPFNFTSIAGESPHGARPDGQHRGLEAGLERRLQRAFHHGDPARGRPARRRHQHGARHRQ